MIILTSVPDLALMANASNIGLGGTKYGVSMYSESPEHSIMARNWHMSGLRSWTTGSPGTTCIGVSPAGSTCGNRAGRPDMSSLVVYSQSSANILPSCWAWGPTILTAASLHSPRGPSPMYSSPMLNPP